MRSGEIRGCCFIGLESHDAEDFLNEIADVMNKYGVARLEGGFITVSPDNQSIYVLNCTVVADKK